MCHMLKQADTKHEIDRQKKEVITMCKQEEKNAKTLFPKEYSDLQIKL